MAPATSALGGRRPGVSLNTRGRTGARILQFHSFRARILTFVVGLLIIVQGAVLLAANTANVRQARRHVVEALELTAHAFRRSLASREQILLEKVRLLSSDFAFKGATATGEHGTALSALENHQARVGADAMLLLDMDGIVLADTLHPEVSGVPSTLQPLIVRAMASEFGEASSITFVDDEPYQMVLVPLFTPEPTAWVGIGFAIHDGLARELQMETGTHVSLLGRKPAGWEAFCSTLAPQARQELASRVAEHSDESEQIFTTTLAGVPYLSSLVPPDGGESPVVAVLQRSLEDALRPFLRLRRFLLVIFAVGLLLSAGGGMLLAARVTRPVADLAEAARRVQLGDYGQPVEVLQRDELGVLATSFNRMMTGIAERDRIRDLLGRVVSPEIAEELLGKGIELGGEERKVSVLFSDLRNFTSISEREPPQRVVAMLNIYLTRVSAIVEQHGGVVSEYVGDAVMALFGAPLQHDDDALRAVRTALEIRTALSEINQEIVAHGGDPLGIGIGVNTATVIAGTMGSLSRLKYTVVGDGVNLASRLEGLTKRYRVSAIVSAATRDECPGIVFRELDRVRVKGRDAPVGIFEPWGERAMIAPERIETLALHDQAIERFRARDWDAAEERFRDVERRSNDDPIPALYLERIADLRSRDPGPDWDGTVTYDRK